MSISKSRAGIKLHGHHQPRVHLFLHSTILEFGSYLKSQVTSWFQMAAGDPAIASKYRQREEGVQSKTQGFLPVKSERLLSNLSGSPRHYFPFYFIRQNLIIRS